MFKAASIEEQSPNSNYHLSESSRRIKNKTSVPAATTTTTAFDLFKSDSQPQYSISPPIFNRHLQIEEDDFKGTKAFESSEEIMQKISEQRKKAEIEVNEILDKVKSAFLRFTLMKTSAPSSLSSNLVNVLHLLERVQMIGRDFLKSSPSDVSELHQTIDHLQKLVSSDPGPAAVFIAGMVMALAPLSRLWTIYDSKHPKPQRTHRHLHHLPVVPLSNNNNTISQALFTSPTKPSSSSTTTTTTSSIVGNGGTMSPIGSPSSFSQWLLGSATETLSRKNKESRNSTRTTTSTDTKTMMNLSSNNQMNLGSHSTMSSSPSSKKLLCRICEEEIPQQQLKEHSQYCALVKEPKLAKCSLDQQLNIIHHYLTQIGGSSSVRPYDFSALQSSKDSVTLVVTDSPREGKSPSFVRGHRRFVSESAITVENSAVDPRVVRLQKITLCASTLNTPKCADRCGKLATKLDKLCNENDNHVALQTFGVKVLSLVCHGDHITHAQIRTKLEELKQKNPSGLTSPDKSATKLVSINDFEFLKPISRGAFGRVFLAKKVKTGDYYAIKVLKKVDMVKKNMVDHVIAERNILAQNQNNFVVTLYYAFQTDLNFYLVMEYCNGGDIASLLRRVEMLSEDLTRVYIAETVLALEYLHSMGTVHRDLKPENMLIDAKGHIKLTDFGLSQVGRYMQDKGLPSFVAKLKEEGKEFGETSNLWEEFQQRRRKTATKTRIVGTPDYLSPEILLGMDEGSPGVDWWSLGVIMFECLTGVPPFNDETPLKVFQNILNRDIPWPESICSNAKEIIDELLSLHPEKRLGINGANDVKQKEFFSKIQWDDLRKSENIIVPAPKDLADTSMFHKRNSIYKSEEHDLTTTHSPGSSSSSSSAFIVPIPSSDAIQIPIGKQQQQNHQSSASSSELQNMEDREEIKNFSFKNLSSLRDMTQQMLRLMGEDATSVTSTTATSTSSNQK